MSSYVLQSNICGPIILRFVEIVNDSTIMTVQMGDLFISQSYGDNKRRILRLTRQNVEHLLPYWGELVAVSAQAREDRIVSLEIALGDRVKASTSTDFPNINFRRWRLPSWNG